PSFVASLHGVPWVRTAVRAVQLVPRAYGMPLADKRPAWIVARSLKALGNDMRRIVPGHSGGSTNESPDRRFALQRASTGGALAEAPAPVPIPPPRPTPRPCVRGKFLFVGDEKLYVRGVT